MIYDKLLGTSPFTGMTLDELQMIISHTKMDFHKVRAGNVIIRKGDRAGFLLILLDGSVTVESQAHDGSFAFTETVNAPTAIGVQTLFGRFKEFTRKVTAQSTIVSAIKVDKDEVIKLIDKSFIFRTNILNALSTAVQKDELQLWQSHTTDGIDRGIDRVKEEITEFIRQRCIVPTGSKLIHITMNTLASLLGHRRLIISTALNDMQDHHLIQLSRGKIIIPNLKVLLSFNNK